MTECESSPSAASAEASANSAKALLLAGLHDANLAYALALCGSSTIPVEEGRKLVRGLVKVRATGFDAGTCEIDRFWDGVLRQRLGNSAAWLNADRSKFEAFGVAFLLAIRKRILDLARVHLTFAETTVTVAEEHRDTIIANPAPQANGSVSTLGHCLLTFVYPAFRDLERLQHCFRNFNSSPSGAGREVAGVRLPVDRERLSTLLGFDSLRQHAGDALWHTDGAIELMAAIVALLVNLNRLADDLQSWSEANDSMDVTWIRSFTSSLLAKVPVLASLGKECGENAEGCVAVAEELCAAFDGAIRAIGVVTSLVVQCGKAVTVGSEPEIHSAKHSDLVDMITIRGGMDYANARRMSREIDRLISKGEIELRMLTPEALDVIAIQIVGHPLNLTAMDLASATEPGQMIKARRSPGGVAPERVVEMITECRARLVREGLWVSTAGQRLVKSEVLLLAEASDAVGR
jgi:argininosuccinate lyase